MHNLTDRALKERIIGAVVLVVFAVLVVPIFLDGPSQDAEIVTESVTLPGQNAQGRQQQTIVLERDRSQPVPASNTVQAAVAAPPPPAETERDVAPSVPEPESEPEEAPAERTEVVAQPAAAASKSETGMWAVQLGSFSNKENAERLAADLRDQGFIAFLSQLQTDGGALQRVRIGPQKDRESAEAIAQQLAKSGHAGRVVPHP